LQREANGRFGFSARTTLSLAQSLYEKHKVLTYPRTDSRALPEDYVATVRRTLEALEESNAYTVHAHKILANKWIKPANRRVFDNAKVSDHFAIIPTPQLPKALNELEAKLYDLVMKRFLAVFFPSAEFLQTTRLTRVEGEVFKSEGKVLVEAGWLAVYGKEVDDEATGNLTPVAKGEKPNVDEVLAKALATRPPARYNEATLLGAMESAGKQIDDEELKAAMLEKGLGTPATRASIIEGLINERYVRRENRELIPTPKAFSLVTLLRGLGVPELFSAELTAQWETQLAEMERGRLKRDAFMNGISEMARHIVGQAKGHESDTVPGDFATLSAPCPKCGGQIKENYKKFACTTCEFNFFKILASRQISEAEANTLLTERRVGPLEGFRSKIGRAFSADLILNDSLEIEFNWGQNSNDSETEGEPIDFSSQTPLGTCPKCQSRVFEIEGAYICERGTIKPRQCEFRMSKLILQQPIEKEQFLKLLNEGKTDLLPKFISNKTKRPFAAFLVRKPDGDIGFEFAPREPKAAAKKAPTKRKTTAV
jgi:DNA topoisomerase-3